MRSEKVRYNHYPKDNIVTTLDSILDTRLGLLHNINADIARETLLSGLYHNRIRDNFGSISQDVFKALYRFRTKELLEFALPSILLRDIISMLIMISMDLPQKAGDVQTLVYVNTYPYDLTENEINKLNILIANILGMSTDFVKMINMSYSELTPSWCNQNAHNIVMYDGMDWLEYQTSTTDMLKNPLVGAKLYVPLLINGTIELNNITEDNIKSMVNYYKFIVDIEFLDVKFFCIPDREENEENKNGESEGVHKSTDEGKDKGTN